MKQIRKIALLIPESRSFERGLINGIIHYSNLHGPWMLWQKPQYYQEAESLALEEAIRDFAPNGIIIREQSCTGDNEKLLKLGIPTVFIPYLSTPLETRLIQTDNDAISQMAADYLLTKGFRHFAYCGYANLPWSVRRAESFVRYLETKGFKTHCYTPPIVPEPVAWKDRRRLLSEWLLQLPGPVAVLTCNDDRGREVAEACRNADIAVPDQAAVLGIDDDQIVCNLTCPTLSSITLNTEKAGYEIARILDEWITTGQKPRETVHVRPIAVAERHSTDVLLIDDPLVQQAIRFIQNHSASSIQVEDCIQALCVSRRTLQQRVQRALGRTLHDQIQQARVARICKMLIESNLSVKQIALSLGYSSDKHISRIFRKEKGMSLVEFRRQYGRV